MKIGDILLISFPLAEFVNKKVRPVVICEIKNKDIIVCAISSVVPKKLSQNEILLKPTLINHLRKLSVIKIDCVFIIKKENIILRLGKLSPTDFVRFKDKFHSLIEN